MPCRPIFPALLLLLSACGSEGPVAEHANVAPSEEQLGDIAADGLAAPANAALAETIDRASAPLPVAGLRWVWRDEQRSALFGPEQSKAMLSIECQLPARRLVLTRYVTGPDGAMTTLSLTGNGHVASIPLDKRPGEAAGNVVWRGIASGDNARAMARLFDGAGPVETSLGDTENLILPPSAVPRRAFAACL